MYDQSLDCVHNAYKALLSYRKEGKDGRVIFVYDPPHAYLLITGRLLNKGTTFGDASYPDYSSRQIQSLISNGKAEDITDSLDFARNSGYEEPYYVNGKPFRLSQR